METPFRQHCRSLYLNRWLCRERLQVPLPTARLRGRFVFMSSQGTHWGPGVNMEETCRVSAPFPQNAKKRKECGVFWAFPPISGWLVVIIQSQLSVYSIWEDEKKYQRFQLFCFHQWIWKQENSCLHAKQQKGQILLCPVLLTSLNSPRERGAGVTCWAGQQRRPENGEILQLNLLSPEATGSATTKRHCN